jgi:hypothetical protein
LKSFRGFLRFLIKVRTYQIRRVTHGCLKVGNLIIRTSRLKNNLRP